MVLSGSRADEEPPGDLGVRQAFSDKPQYLDLPLGKQADRSRAGTALRSERAQECRCDVCFPADAERFQFISSLARGVHRNLRGASGKRPG